MQCKVLAETDFGQIEWVDGHLNASASALNRIHKADPDGLYGPMPSVTIEDAYKYPLPFADLLRQVFPGSKVIVEGLEDEPEDMIH